MTFLWLSRPGALLGAAARKGRGNACMHALPVGTLAAGADAQAAACPHKGQLRLGLRQ